MKKLKITQLENERLNDGELLSLQGRGLLPPPPEGSEICQCMIDSEFNTASLYGQAPLPPNPPIGNPNPDPKPKYEY